MLGRDNMIISNTIASNNNLKIGYDTAFALNDFSQPKLRSELELVKNTLLYILFTKPGQYPSLPNIGLDIETLLYNFYDEIDVNEFIKDIAAQCNALGAYFNDGTIQIKKVRYKDAPSLIIYIDGTESYPVVDNYLINGSTMLGPNQYMIGITFDELDKMIYNISDGGA